MNIASAIKVEIERVAKRIVRHQLLPLQKSLHGQRQVNAQLRAELLKLKRQLTEQKRAVKARALKPKKERRHAPRFTAELCRQRRQKLGLSQKAFSQLLGVSPLSIYNYEKGLSLPRSAPLEAFANLATVGKREAQRRVAALTE